MTDAELLELEKKAKAATPGPWKAVGECVADSDRYVLANCNTNFSKGQVNSNAAYIAAANPAVVLEMITELRQAKAERDWLAETLETHSFMLELDAKNEIQRCSEQEWLRRAKEAICQK